VDETHKKLMDFENCFQVGIDSGRLPEPAQYSKKQKNRSLTGRKKKRRG
jgi:hypothetical protein